MAPEEEYNQAEKKVRETFKAYQEAIAERIRAGFKLPKSWCGSCQASHHPPYYVGSCRPPEVD